MDIRDIEKIIDQAHESNDVFKTGKRQTIFDLITSFEDMCSLILMGAVLNPLALSQLVDQMDALNTALYWTEQLCHNDHSEEISIDISEERYNKCSILLKEYAYPYSTICSGYIAYSRKRFEAKVEGNCVTFNQKDEQNKSAWSDIIREQSESSLFELASIFNPMNLMQASEKLTKQISVEDGALCYSLSCEVLDAFSEVAQKQWDASKTLPSDWKFDLFSLEEYKEFWISIAALCYIHLFSCYSITDPLIRVKNSTIIEDLESIIDYVVSQTSLEKAKIATIIEYITYNPKKKNVDIMYQPIVNLGDNRLVLAPILFMGSRPERNLLSVVSTMRDKEYSKEVNDLEELMVSELASFVDSPNTVMHKQLRKDLPDIDFAVLDIATRSAMVCETKWFAAADSAKEIYSKEDEITHGCQQVEDIMSYALNNREYFFNQVFGVSDGDTIDLFGCVVAKHNIRTQHKYVPVIDLKRLEELLSSHSLNRVFHIIRNHEYELEVPDEAVFTHQDILYAGFKFRIPAICYGSELDF